MDELCEEEFGKTQKDLQTAINCPSGSFKYIPGLTLLKTCINVFQKEAETEWRLMWKFADVTDNFNFTVKIKNTNEIQRTSVIETESCSHYGHIIKRSALLIKFFEQFGWHKRFKTWLCHSCGKATKIAIDMTYFIGIRPNDADKFECDTRFEIATKISQAVPEAEKANWCQCN